MQTPLRTVYRDHPGVKTGVGRGKPATIAAFCKKVNRRLARLAPPQRRARQEILDIISLKATNPLAFAAVLYKNTDCLYTQPITVAPAPMIKLTARQEQILNLIKDAIENTGFPPTRAEIANELGFKSANAAEEHLQALARKGAIEISPGTSRGIRLTGATTSEPAPVKVPAALLMSLPLIGRVAAGSPILAEENLEASYNVDPALFSAKPDFLLKVRGWST